MIRSLDNIVLIHKSTLTFQFYYQSVLNKNMSTFIFKDDLTVF